MWNHFLCTLYCFDAFLLMTSPAGRLLAVKFHSKDSFIECFMIFELLRNPTFIIYGALGFSYT